MGGFVDSWPETLVPSASNRSTPEWTLVDSRQGRIDEKQLRARAAVARRFSFFSTYKFPTRRQAIPWEIALRNVKGHESGARNELMMGNGRRLEARKQRLFFRPLPVIGVRRAIMQCRAHDDDRAAPVVAPGPENRWHRHFSPRPRNRGVFSGTGCRWIRGLLARNPCAIGIQPVHTRVDSCGLPPRASRRKPTSR